MLPNFENAHKVILISPGETRAGRLDMSLRGGHAGSWLVSQPEDVESRHAASV